MYIYWGFLIFLLGLAVVFFILRPPLFFLRFLSHGDFFYLLQALRFDIFLLRFSRSSWYRKEVSFWAYLEGDIVSITLFLGGFGYDCFWTRDTGFVF